jgi:hypothetical protein
MLSRWAFHKFLKGDVKYFLTIDVCLQRVRHGQRSAGNGRLAGGGQGGGGGGGGGGTTAPGFSSKI